MLDLLIASRNFCTGPKLSSGIYRTVSGPIASGASVSKHINWVVSLTFHSVLQECSFPLPISIISQPIPFSARELFRNEGVLFEQSSLNRSSKNINVSKWFTLYHAGECNTRMLASSKNSPVKRTDEASSKSSDEYERFTSQWILKHLIVFRLR